MKLEATFVVLCMLAVLVPVATPAAAWHEGCDPEYPCDPRPHGWKEIVADGICYVKRLAQQPC
jgi:hypothetical protein